MRCTFWGIASRGQGMSSPYSSAVATFDIAVGIDSATFDSPTWVVTQPETSIRRTSGTADIPGHAGEPGITLGALFVDQHRGELAKEIRLEPTRQQDDAFRSYAATLQGTPAPGRSFGLARMLYVSGVTLTTLGYGGFVPITPAARALSLSEAFLGVVTLSLIFYLLGIRGEAAKERPSTGGNAVVGEADR